MNNEQLAKLFSGVMVYELKGSNHKMVYLSTDLFNALKESEFFAENSANEYGEEAKELYKDLFGTELNP